jgi:hypothetical protein
VLSRRSPLDERVTAKENAVKIRKSILLGIVAFAIGMGFTTTAFAQKSDWCYKICMSINDDAVACYCECFGCPPPPGM